MSQHQPDVKNPLSLPACLPGQPTLTSGPYLRQEVMQSIKVDARCSKVAAPPGGLHPSVECHQPVLQLPDLPWPVRRLGNR